MDNISAAFRSVTTSRISMLSLSILLLKTSSYTLSTETSTPRGQSTNCLQKLPSIGSAPFCSISFDFVVSV